MLDLVLVNEIKIIFVFILISLTNISLIGLILLKALQYKCAIAVFLVKIYYFTKNRKE